MGEDFCLRYVVLPHQPRRHVKCGFGLCFSRVRVVGRIKAFLDSLNYAVIKIMDGRAADSTCLCKFLDRRLVKGWQKLWRGGSASSSFLRRLACPVIVNRSCLVCRSLRHLPVGGR
jgi:hypothetical protein